MERDPQNFQINQAVFEKKIKGFSIGKWQEEGGNLSCIGQLGTNGKRKQLLSTDRRNNPLDLAVEYRETTLP